MAVRVVTDSACDLPPEICEANGITVVPLTIRFGEEEFVDRIELTNAQFWDRLRASSQLPETAAPSVGAFEETFRRLADEGADGIVCVCLSSQLSATLQSAQLGAKALEGVCPVAVIDSLSASMGIGSLALHAAQRAAAGRGFDEIVAEIEDFRSRQRLFALVDTLEYLHKGGRIGGAKALVGSVLSIKPIITVVDGRVEEAGKVRTRSKGLRFLLDKVKESPVESINVMHSQAPDVQEFVDELRPLVPGIDVVVGEIGPVVGVHTGPGVIGVTLVTRQS